MNLILLLDILRIGDLVTFKCSKYGGLLCAEGILLEDLIILDQITVFDDFLFRVHLQRQYSAARELDEFLRINKLDPKAISDPNTLKYYQALKVSIILFKNGIYFKHICGNYNITEKSTERS